MEVQMGEKGQHESTEQIVGPQLSTKGIDAVVRGGEEGGVGENTQVHCGGDEGQVGGEVVWSQNVGNWTVVRRDSCLLLRHRCLPPPHRDPAPPPTHLSLPVFYLPSCAVSRMHALDLAST